MNTLIIQTGSIYCLRPSGSEIVNIQQEMEFLAAEFKILKHELKILPEMKMAPEIHLEPLTNDNN